jgi:drug/metabolite transporter (DMT)-like permease
MKSTSADRAALIGVGLMLLAAVVNSLDAVIVRVLAHHIHPFVIGFTRSLFGLLVVVPWILSRREILGTSYRLMHVARAALKLGALVAFFAAFAVAPLADVTAIAFAAPIFVTVGAWLFLGERVRKFRVVAVVIGFVGVIIVLRPGQSDVSPALALALLGASLTAVIHLMLKIMSAKDSMETLVAWNLILTVPLAIIPAVWFWTSPTLSQWVLLALQGALGAFNMAVVTRAFALAEASLIAPIDFLRLPVVAIMALFFFSELASVATWIGGAVIFVSTLMMMSSFRGRNAGITEEL